MFDKVSICFCRQQDNRKSPPQSPAKYVKTMVRVVVDDAICFLCVRISWKKPKHTEFIAHYSTEQLQFQFWPIIACKNKKCFLDTRYCCKNIGINCTVGQGRPRWSASEKQIVADGSTFDYMYGLMNTTGIFISTKNQSFSYQVPPETFHLVFIGLPCNGTGT